MSVSEDKEGFPWQELFAYMVAQAAWDLRRDKAAMAVFWKLW